MIKITHSNYIKGNEATINQIKTMRTINQIESDLKTATNEYVSYNNLQNEGATDGFNPYESEISELSSELVKANKESELLEWTPELLAERRAWFNAQCFKTPLAAYDGCESKGFKWSAMKDAVKRLG